MSTVVDTAPTPAFEVPGDLAVLTPDCPSLRFRGPWADVEALRCGNSSPLRPEMDRVTRVRVPAMPPPSGEVAVVFGGNGFVGTHLALC
jgi:hypothetical protein